MRASHRVSIDVRWLQGCIGVLVTAQCVDLVLKIVRKVFDLLLNILVQLDLVGCKQVVNLRLRVFLVHLDLLYLSFDPSDAILKS